jgi:hypothetical protein
VTGGAAERRLTIDTVKEKEEHTSTERLGTRCSGAKVVLLALEANILRIHPHL